MAVTPGKRRWGWIGDRATPVKGARMPEKVLGVCTVCGKSSGDYGTICTACYGRGNYRVQTVASRLDFDFSLPEEER